MFIEKKLQAIEDRTHLNIKSGHVMIDVKDRDWLLSTIKNLMGEYEQLKTEKDKWFNAYHNQIMKPF